jgi:hypothetical protein
MGGDIKCFALVYENSNTVFAIVNCITNYVKGFN